MPQDRPKQLDSPLLPKIFKYASKAHVWVYRRTGGRIGGKWRIGAASQAGADAAARAPRPQVRHHHGNLAFGPALIVVEIRVELNQLGC
jgi:hypothetical protein